ncbi:MAG TPA: hypothetical protein VHB79_10765 [Polyangiaceae bacterium]|nr:hypothetical protein [Polyangiaceae bacterium]
MPAALDLDQLRREHDASADPSQRRAIRRRARESAERRGLPAPHWAEAAATPPKPDPEALPGLPLSPLAMPSALYAWVCAHDGRAVRVLSTGAIVLCGADGVCRTYPSIAAALAGAAE